MKRYLIYLITILLFAATQVSATVVVINTGTAGTPEYNVGPVYMSSTLFYRASRFAYLYTASELSAAGITSGSVITDLGWMKNNSASSLASGKFRIYMKNSSAASYSNATETWTNLNAGTTMTYENLTQLIPATAAPNYIPFTLNTPFTYTGGSLEISVEWDATASSTTLATGSFDWVWSTVTDRIYANGNTTLSNSLSSTFNNTTMDDRRPFIQITYNTPVTTAPGCVTTPTTPAIAASVCPGATTLSWPAVTGATGYDVYLNTGATATTIVATNQPGTTYTTTLAAGTYAWKIIPKNTVGPATGCTNFTFTVNPPVIPTVAITASPAGTICAGTPVTFTATATNAGAAPTYQWKKRSANTGTGTATYTDNTLITGDTISVVLTSNAACASPATVTSNLIIQNVVPRPGAAITPATTTTVCTGGSILFNANTGTGLTYQWQLGGTNITGANTAAYTATAAGNYRVIVSNGNCTDTSVPVTLNVVARPVATITYTGPAAFCQGESLLLSGPAPVAGNTYQWQLNTANITGATANTYNASVIGNYRLIISNGACADTSAPVAITVNPKPVATATAAGPTAFCNGGSVVINANTGTGITYRWLRNNTPITPAATAAAYTATIAGNYRVLVTNATIGCSDTSAAVTITVYTQPAATVTQNGPLTFCHGGSVLLTAAAGTGYTYQWYKDGIAIAGATTIAHTATTSGTYHVVIINGTCTTTTTGRNVVVNPLPAAVITPAGATAFCAGGAVVLSAPAGTGFTYQWQLNGANIAGASSASYTATATGSYTVIVSNGTCNNTAAAIAVTVSTPPIAVITATGAPSFCQGNSVTLQTTAAAGYAYQWHLNGTNITGATAATFTASVSGNYTVTVVNGTCTATSAPFAVGVTPAPPAVITPAGPLAFCQGGSVTLNASRGTSYTYQWTKDGTDIPGATNYQYTAVASGDYGVRLSDGICPAVATPVTVTVNNFPAAVITVTGGVNLATGAFNSYQWYRNGVLIPGATGQTYTALRDGFYSVVVTDAAGCSATSAVQQVSALDVSTVGSGYGVVSIWPNPAAGLVNVTAEKAVNIQVASIDGKLLLQADNARSIDISPLAQGIYLIRVYDHRSGALIRTDKLMKKQ